MGRGLGFEGMGVGVSCGEWGGASFLPSFLRLVVEDWHGTMALFGWIRLMWNRGLRDGDGDGDGDGDRDGDGDGHGGNVDGKLRDVGFVYFYHVRCTYRYV